MIINNNFVTIPWNMCKSCFFFKLNSIITLHKDFYESKASICASIYAYNVYYLDTLLKLKGCMYG